jgi:hypothetical protein
MRMRGATAALPAVKAAATGRTAAARALGRGPAAATGRRLPGGVGRG